MFHFVDHIRQMFVFLSIMFDKCLSFCRSCSTNKYTETAKEVLFGTVCTLFCMIVTKSNPMPVSFQLDLLTLIPDSNLLKNLIRG